MHIDAGWEPTLQLCTLLGGSDNHRAAEWLEAVRHMPPHIFGGQVFALGSVGLSSVGLGTCLRTSSAAGMVCHGGV